MQELIQVLIRFAVYTCGGTGLQDDFEEVDLTSTPFTVELTSKGFAFVFTNGWRIELHQPYRGGSIFIQTTVPYDPGKMIPCTYSGQVGHYYQAEAKEVFNRTVNELLAA